VIDGGFDPIPLAADEGDTLRIVVSLSNGGMAAARMVVPARRRPRVVRTSPTAGRRDVAINASVVVVFSEPIAASSVNPANVRVLKESAAVPGTVRFVEGSPTSIEFVPETPLEPGAAYQLVVGAGVVDLSGDAIEAAVTVPFSTVPAEQAGPAFDDPLGILTIPVRGIVAFEPGGTYLEVLTDPAEGRPDDLWTNDGFPAWSRDGKRIAFRRITRITAEGNSAEEGSPVVAIYVMNADGSNPVRITPLDAFADRPAWAPDGSRIAFQKRRNGFGDLYMENDADIFVMNADGSDPVQLVNTPQPSWGAAWSPDGTKIAYVSGELSARDIFVINPDGSGMVNLTNDAAQDFDPDWSPDGSRIAFVKDGDLYVMNADGTNPSRVAQSAGGGEYITMPRWSPDGLSILYATYSPCGWWFDTCPDPERPAIIVRLSDGAERALPAYTVEMWAGQWSWRARGE
jgi:hypothetical protein